MRFTLYTLFAVLATLFATALAVPVVQPGSLMGRRYVVNDAPRIPAAPAVVAGRTDATNLRRADAARMLANAASRTVDTRANRFQKRLAQRAAVNERASAETVLKRAAEEVGAPRKLADTAVKARTLGRRSSL